MGDNALKKTGLTGTGMALISVGAALVSGQPSNVYGYVLIGVGLGLVLIKYKLLGE